MLRPIDRPRRDGPLYPGAARTLRDCIDPKHLLLRIDSTFDVAALAADLEQRYHPTTGRPGIHPEIVLRALLLAGLYGVPSNRELCQRISENLAWRWFCHLTLDDPVFDHSTLSVFLDRVGPDDLQRVFDRLNAALAEAGLLSGRTYLDSSLVAANVRTQTLAPRDEGDDPPTPAGGEEDVFVARATTPRQGSEPAQIRLLRYQDAEGRLPLPLHDRECRWRTLRGRSVLGYKEHVLVDRSGFILARGRTPANVSDVAGALPLLDALPLHPRSLTADTGYRAGSFRHALQRRGITPYIPVAPTQDVTPEDFTDHFDHFVCQQGALLLPMSGPDADQSVRYQAPVEACRPCPLRASCVSPSRVAKQLWASRYRVTYPRAHRLNATLRAAREQRHRKTVVEGVFARLDRLGGTRARSRGRERGDQHGTMTAIAHNILKAMTKRRFFHRDAPALPPSTAHPVRSVLVHRRITVLGAPRRSPVPLQFAPA